MGPWQGVLETLLFLSSFPVSYIDTVPTTVQKEGQSALLQQQYSI